MTVSMEAIRWCEKEARVISKDLLERAWQVLDAQRYHSLRPCVYCRSPDDECEPGCKLDRTRKDLFDAVAVNPVQPVQRYWYREMRQWTPGSKWSPEAPVSYYGTRAEFEAHLKSINDFEATSQNSRTVEIDEKSVDRISRGY